MESAPLTTILQIPPEETAKSVKGDELHTVVEVHMASTRDPYQFLWLGSTIISILAEFARMGLIARDKEQGSGRDGSDVIERVEVEELDQA